MKLSIIIVSWNTQQLTLKCLKSIFKYVTDINFEVFLVDNNSNDRTLEEVENFKQKNRLDNLHIIANSKNVGFAKANNYALQLILRNSTSQAQEGKGKDSLEPGIDHFILLLNSDTQLIDNSIGKMIDFATRSEKIGIVGPKLLNPDRTLQRSCRRFPRLVDQVFVQLKFYNFFPEKIKPVREYFMLDFDHNQVREVDQVMGAAMLIRKEVFEKIGLLDEGFWAVFEEVDFCKRAKDAGYKIYFYPHCQIIHHKEQSFKQIASLKKQINFNQSLYRYFRKHRPRWQLIILWLIQPVNLLLTWIDEKLGIRNFFGKSKDL